MSMVPFPLVKYRKHPPAGKSHSTGEEDKEPLPKVTQEENEKDGQDITTYILYAYERKYVRKKKRRKEGFFWTNEMPFSSGSV